MKIKMYILFSFIYISIIGILVYFENPLHYKMIVFDNKIDLPIAIWFIAPLIILWILTILHLVFFNILNWMKVKSQNAERGKTETLIFNLILEKKSKIIFSHQEFSDIQNTFNESSIKNINILSIENEEIKNAISLRADIESGIYRKDINKFNLDGDNALVKHNLLNKIEFNRNFASEIIKKYKEYNQDVIKKAFLFLVEKKEVELLKPIFDNIHIDKDMALALLGASQESNVAISECVFLSKKASLNSDDFLALLDSLTEESSPEQMLEFFEELSSSLEEAIDSYIYLLLTLELQEKAKELLENASDKYMRKFQLYLEIKKDGINCDISDFI